MDKTDLEQILKKAICDNTKLKEKAYEIKNDDSLINSGIDSYQMTKIIIQIEDELSIKFQDDDLIFMDFNTMGDFIYSIDKVRNSREN